MKYKLKQNLIYFSQVTRHFYNNDTAQISLIFGLDSSFFPEQGWIKVYSSEALLLKNDYEKRTNKYNAGIKYISMPWADFSTKFKLMMRDYVHREMIYV